MKVGANLLAATLVAIIYGVLFSISYPDVEISSGIAALCALLGLATCLAISGLWKFVMGSKSS
jgi:uncharacterized membrane protein